MTGVSVVIAAYRAVPDIGEQLSALESQTYDGPVEVIVSDNEGSADLATFVRSHPASRALSIQVVEASGTPGTSHARNVGTRAARYDLIAYCDQDDAVHSTWLEALVDAAESADLVGGPLERDTLNDAVVASWRALPDPDRPVVLGRYLPMSFGCNLAVRRRAFDSVGGWDESYPTAGSDIDFCWRVQESGHDFGFAPGAMVAYRFRTGMMDSFHQASEYGCAEARVARQHGAIGRQWWWFPVHCAVVLGTAPVWPWGWSRGRRGAWMWVTGNLIGRIRGSVRYRILYW
ncbi:glycosyltransferase [Rhodococcus sp. BP-349]|uniref:glycosyltransferase family 2 protein n=1 Tax=unclassified Rhodococcus (in: high G+C Gram-positive bacteria) TaxID=192944 RepID=UPI001C9B06F0|nr:MULTISPECIES: glycosyltransferase [unclassified Rhodococcus (in: high G+C Gram-positive bacteria)]MBY6538125.1 glycosyltransferase [Rhodococcus sp. BP-363]MBY6542462.1 glycosyltransferase [Rhodococcus sp. BP-369]MBY6561692.1 glycosyltransferase [Rhodococcus sp. BP-370]MBY6575984.1 glycosyltransferase [Rhodococcus sp. BP-364]MBY6585285.1 glycosyltransferase [Rhodococcus sp. BP-358]